MPLEEKKYVITGSYVHSTMKMLGDWLYANSDVYVKQKEFTIEALKQETTKVCREKVTMDRLVAEELIMQKMLVMIIISESVRK